MQQIDARGLSCPEPVMITRAALIANPAGVVVLVDNLCAVENITRYATHQRFAVTREQQENEYKLTLTKQ